MLATSSVSHLSKSKTLWGFTGCVPVHCCGDSQDSRWGSEVENDVFFFLFFFFWLCFFDVPVEDLNIYFSVFRGRHQWDAFNDYLGFCPGCCWTHGHLLSIIVVSVVCNAAVNQHQPSIDFWIFEIDAKFDQRMRIKVERLTKYKTFKQKAKME